MKVTKIGAVQVISHETSRIADTVKFIGSGKVVLGENSQIREFTVIEMDKGSLTIGNNTVIGYQSMIQCTGEIQIGNNVLLGPQNILIASYHPQSFNPAIQKTLERSKIVIHDNVWTGAGVVMNHGITLEKDCIVGACSYVNKSVGGGSIAAGTPAKTIKKRKGDS